MLQLQPACSGRTRGRQRAAQTCVEANLPCNLGALLHAELAPLLQARCSAVPGIDVHVLYSTRIGVLLLLRRTVEACDMRQLSSASGKVMHHDEKGTPGGWEGGSRATMTAMASALLPLLEALLLMRLLEIQG